MLERSDDAQVAGVAEFLNRYSPALELLDEYDHSKSTIYFLGSSVRMNFPARSDVSRSCSWPSTFV